MLLLFKSSDLSLHFSLDVRKYPHLESTRRLAHALHLAQKPGPKAPGEPCTAGGPAASAGAAGSHGALTPRIAEQQHPAGSGPSRYDGSV